MIRAHRLGLALLCCASATAAAAQADGVALTLDETVARALSTSAKISEADARTAAATASADLRHAAILPQVVAQAGYTRTNHVDEFGILLPNNQLRVIYPDVPDNYRTRLDVQWPLYTAGRTSLLERAARGEAGALARDTEAFKAAIKLEAAAAYWSLAVAIESVSVCRESLARSEAHLADVQSQLAAGLISPGDVMTAQAHTARQRMLLIQAESRREVSEVELARIVGAAAGTPIRLMTALDPPRMPVEDAATLTTEARERRPERAAISGRMIAAEQRHAAAAAGAKPTIGVAGGVDMARPNARIFPRQAAWKESWDASIAVNWALFDGGRVRAEVAEAAALARGVRARLADFDTGLAAEVRQRRSELQSSLAAIPAAEEALRAATEARRVAGERFRAGVATSTEVTDAQVVLLQAGLDRAGAIAASRIAEARLDRIVGR